MDLSHQRPDLAFEKMEPARHPVLDRDMGDAPLRPVMDVVRERDLLLTYPYQSFDHLIRLLREAAIDPSVTAISMTLYRAARRSQVVYALYNAARNGKRVFVSIELQARFDEKNNIKISQFLSEAGVTVVYGVPPMKTHAKLLLIERKDGLIAGLSTGNYNEVTARLYVDSLLLTTDRRLTGEVEDVFSFLDNASRLRTLPSPKYRHLLVSPFNTRRTILRMIEREKARKKDGYILIKVNHLTDDKVTRRLREAADAGVQMDLIVRTTYAMLPHKNIRAISILDRYLEHQRVYIFGRGEDRAVFMSSADLMERNLDWRVEVAFPVYDPALIDQVSDMMQIQVQDTYKARILDETQSNAYVSGRRGRKRGQYRTYDYFRKMADKALGPE
jgi:polyphosphate kinase